MSENVSSAYTLPKPVWIFAAGVLVCALMHPRAGAQTEQDSPPAQAAPESEIYIPSDLDDAMTQLDRILRSEDLDTMRTGTEDDMAQYHFGLGMWLRNNWGLWAGSRLARWFNERRIRHPDAMSGIILDSYWRRLHDTPVDLEGQVRSYLAYEDEQRALAKQERERSARAAQRINQLMMGMSLQKTQAAPVKIPKPCGCGPRARHLSKYRNGVLAVIREGDVDEFTTAGYFLDLDRRTLHPLEVREIEHMISSVVVDATAYFSGMTSGKPVLMAIEGEKRVSIQPPLAGAAPMLGINGERLLAVYSNAIYRLQADGWETLYSGSIELPKSGLPPVMFGQRIYFRDEGTGENGKQLWWLELEPTPRLVLFTEDTELVGANGPRWENATSYCVTKDKALWITLGESNAPSALVRRSIDGSYAIAVINDGLAFDGDLMGGEATGDDLPITAVALDAHGELIALGDRGLYAIEGRRIRELIAFDVPLDEEYHKHRWAGDLNNLLDMGGGRYVLSGAFGGIYLLERDAIGGHHIIPISGTLAAPLKF
jgi:hypothetical protein